ncbi:hypothetical protein [Methylobacterium sp. WL7]|uniref:hypothetical protein n=1 Tax=Methylobacterium sp. WL7 TaxID=2603900 RepID=UPI00164FB9DE|nr:hypothetical protein [Methylobacterium sp. WL7]
MRRDWPNALTLPAIDKPANLTRATHALAQGVAAGEITRSGTVELSRLIDAHVNAITTADLAERLACTMTDAALLAVVLAAPLYAERASLTEDWLWRIVRYIETVGTRDRISGCDDALPCVTQGAGRTTTH